jgi:uncharacterized membrane protein
LGVIQIGGRYCFINNQRQKINLPTTLCCRYIDFDKRMNLKMMPKKTVSILSYLTLIGWAIAFWNYKKGAQSSLAKYHLEQSFGIEILAVATNMIAMLPVIIDTNFAPILIINNLVLVILWMIGLISAYHGVRLPLPFIGFYFKNKFRFIQ